MDEDLRKICDAATPGPWTAKVEETYQEPRCGGIVGPDGVTEIVTTDCGIYGPEMSDAYFIVAARAALPGLLDQITALRTALGDMLERAYDEGGHDDEDVKNARMVLEKQEESK